MDAYFSVSGKKGPQIFLKWQAIGGCAWRANQVNFSQMWRGLKSKHNSQLPNKWP